MKLLFITNKNIKLGKQVFFNSKPKCINFISLSNQDLVSGFESNKCNTNFTLYWQSENLVSEEYPDKSSMEVGVYSSFTNEKLILMELLEIF